MGAEALKNCSKEKNKQRVILKNVELTNTLENTLSHYHSK